MPSVEQWEAFFQPDGILETLGCFGISGDVVEFGCGYGTFTIAAARRVSGIVYATDIDPLMVSATSTRASRAGLRKIVVEKRDFVSEGCGRPDESMSYVMLFNILHIEDPVSLLREALRVVRVGGLSPSVRFPGVPGYAAYLAPFISDRDEEGLSSCSARPCHHVVDNHPAGVSHRITYGAPTLTPVGLTPTERASLCWTHNGCLRAAWRGLRHQFIADWRTVSLEIDRRLAASFDVRPAAALRIRIRSAHDQAPAS
jgi:SAM-dependent methyltransferase